MRLLQLVTAPGETLDLHPNVTIVTGLDEAGRSMLIDTVRGLARSDVRQGRGLLEAHGVLFDFDPSLFEVIEAAPEHLDPVVHLEHLPSQPTSVDADELRAREETFAALVDQVAAQAELQLAARDAVAAAARALDAARRARQDAEGGAAGREVERARLAAERARTATQRDSLETELDALRPDLEAAHAARFAAEDRAVAVQAALEEAASLDAGVTAELAEVNAQIALADPAVVARAAAALHEAEAALDDPPTEGDLTSSERSPLEKIEHLERRRVELERLLSVVTRVEHAAVAQALERLQSDGPAPRSIASSEALELADELDALDAELGPPPWEPAGEADSLAAARSRLDDARQALLEAEHAVRTPVLQPDEIARIEGVHADLSDAIDKADGRFSSARARGRVAELRVVEQEILDDLGFSSYAAYVMGYSLFAPSAEAEASVIAARAELATAEQEWTRLERETGSALARAAALDRRRLLLERAREMLGTLPVSDPPQPALRALRLPAVSDQEAQDILQAALEQAGVALSDERLEHDELVLLAEAWLAEVTLVDERRKALLDELAAVEAAHAALVDEGTAEARSELPVVVAPDAPDGTSVDRDAAIVSLRAALAEAERCLADRDQLVERRASLVADLATASEMEAAARTGVADLDRDLAAAVQAESTLEERTGTLQRELREVEDELAELLRAAEALPTATVHLDALDAAIEEAAAAHAAAAADEERADRALDLLDAEGRASAVEIERLQDIVAAKGTGSASHADELEWYLLARLASQRSVSVAGSLPILLDDALRGLRSGDVTHLLARLERMAEAVQVILVSEDPVAAAWAVDAGPARAAVVSPART